VELLELFTNFKEVGIAALFVWMLWYMRKDLVDLRDRVRQLEDERNKENRGFIKEMTKALQRNTDALSESGQQRAMGVEIMARCEQRVNELCGKA